MRISTAFHVAGKGLLGVCEGCAGLLLNFVVDVSPFVGWVQSAAPPWRTSASFPCAQHQLAAVEWLGSVVPVGRGRRQCRVQCSPGRSAPAWQEGSCDVAVPRSTIALNSYTYPQHRPYVQSSSCCLCAKGSCLCCRGPIHVFGVGALWG